ncbi:hypothetical protein GALMADRAFT_1068799 [Galerina marginata CBS 339.88]|uniref:Uncharacterized protein n=1 Tax=Galerina marginata (strain CBS 339.88) TaxID=685588 RepID=A0A067S9N3_GALM3|nr:hypothetical protein GALMADRAFT_1068799 [Galerina marginata CBS 339.88]
MQGLRPPSYRSIGVSDATFLSSTSSLWPIEDQIYDPLTDRLAILDFEGPKTQPNDRPSRFRPIRRRTVPEQMDQSSPLSMDRPMPFPVEKRRPGVIRPRPSAGQNTRYAFSMGSNLMALTPTVDVEDAHPPYYITVQMNYFMPLSFITSIYRFPNEKVGDFEMGIMTVPGTVQLGTHREAISNVLSKSGSRNSGSYFWNPLAVGLKYCLKWDYDKRPCVCRSTAKNNEGTVLALFTSPFGLDSNSKVAMIEVTPAGQEVFDHVVMSLLIVERKRLTPDKESGLKPFFN